MRKNTLIAVVLILGVIFMALPAFADYIETTNWTNQWPAARNANGSMPSTFTTFGYEVAYGPGTIRVPYIEPTYDSLGCNNTVTDLNGNPIGTGYNCAPDDLTEENAEPTLMIQDMFSAVVEGNTDKGAGNKGISQYLDSLFAFNEGDKLYIDQTLDQDLADLTGGSSTLGTLGIWQRLHSAVDLTGFTDGNGPATLCSDPLATANECVDANYGTTMHLRSIDQTVEAYVADRHPAGTSGSGDLGNIVLSYMGQWFQAGTNVTCNGVGGTDEWNGNCIHNEFGGHGTSSLTGTVYTPNVAQHDP